MSEPIVYKVEFADLAEDDQGPQLILEFCEDITKLVGE